MKGLLTYDLVWLKGQKKLLLILAGLSVLYLATEGPVVLFLSVIFQMILIRTLEWNLQPANSRFLFTLPFTRKQYVLEKYAFILLSSVALTLVLYGLGVAVHPGQLGEMTLMLVVILTELVYFTAFLVPMMIRLGASMQLWLALIVVALVAVTASLVNTLGPIMGQWVDIAGQHMGVIALCLVGLGLVCLSVSMRISGRMLKKREL